MHSVPYDWHAQHALHKSKNSLVSDGSLARLFAFELIGW